MFYYQYRLSEDGFGIFLSSALFPTRGCNPTLSSPPFDLFKNIIDKDERINFVLASYNAGIGHIYDAMALAEKYGHDKYRWIDNVEKYLLLKMKMVICCVVVLVWYLKVSGYGTFKNVSS